MGIQEGISGLYAGLGGSLFGQVPYGMLTFGTYEMYKTAMLNCDGLSVRIYHCCLTRRSLSVCLVCCLGCSAFVSGAKPQAFI